MVAELCGVVVSGPVSRSCRQGLQKESILRNTNPKIGFSQFLNRYNEWHESFFYQNEFSSFSQLEQFEKNQKVRKKGED